jgi:hypothetical protein
MARHAYSSFWEIRMDTIQQTQPESASPNSARLCQNKAESVEAVWTDLCRSGREVHAAEPVLAHLLAPVSHGVSPARICRGKLWHPC